MDLTPRAELGADPAFSDPDTQALAYLRAWQEQAGLVFEDPDAPVEPYTSRKTEEIRGEPWT
jgi:hypothetical protein